MAEWKTITLQIRQDDTLKDDAAVPAGEIIYAGRLYREVPFYFGIEGRIDHQMQEQLIERKRHEAAASIFNLLYGRYVVTKDEHDRRVKELLEANNAEVERRRAVEAQLEDAKEMARSAISIGERNGSDTNWDAFVRRCQKFIKGGA